MPYHIVTDTLSETLPASTRWSRSVVGAIWSILRTEGHACACTERVYQARGRANERVALRFAERSLVLVRTGTLSGEGRSVLHASGALNGACRGKEPPVARQSVATSRRWSSERSARERPSPSLR